MKHALTLALLLSTLHAGAQCAYRVDRVDPFMKFRHRETKALPASESGTSKTLFAFVRLGDTLIMEVTHTAMGLTGKMVSYDHPILLLFDNDSTAGISPVGTYFAKQSLMGLGTVVARYHLPRGTAALLAAVPLRSVRVFTSGGYVDANVKKKRAAKIQGAAACILQE